MYFKIIGPIREVQVISAGLGIRQRRRLWKAYGRASWRKLKGIAQIESKLAYAW
jgi:hypothetical protein